MWFFFSAIALYICYRLLSKKGGSDESIKTTIPSKSHTSKKQYANKTPQRKYPKESLAVLFTSNDLTPINISTFIAGIPHRLGKNVQINSILSAGQTLQPLRELTNQHDRNAIKLMANGAHIGYIPKDDNPKIALHLDSGKTIAVIVTSIDASDLWRGIRIKVSLYSANPTPPSLPSSPDP